MIRAVIDTNVLFEGLTRRGPAAEVIDAWTAREFQPCVSTALVLEYQDVMARKLGQARAEEALKAIQALLDRCEHVLVYFSYRPASRDPGDDLVVDCVLNGGAVLVTENVRDFEMPARTLGFQIFRPAQFVALLRREHTP